jgi:hypothetical protein
MIDPRKAALYRYLLTAAMLGCGGLTACFLVKTPAPDTKVKREEWRESRGPVVPHDTFPSDCTLCHEKGSWHEIRKDFAFDHERETGTALHGAHAQAQCLRCHNDRGAVGLFSKRGCAGCHDDIHRGRLGTQCTGCHSENNWNPTGVYAAHARTRFPLTGVHIGVGCFRCHPAAESGQFLGADPRCEACHRDEAVQAKALDHVAGGLLTGCQRCHTPTSWQNAIFNHSGITGACVDCHRAKYDATTNPNHVAEGFSTDCRLCHNTTSWGRFVHRFPRTGGHNRACRDCHPNMTNFAQFTCITCHDKTTMDAKHQGRRGYSWNDLACYSCHPNGKAD